VIESIVKDISVVKRSYSTYLEGEEAEDQETFQTKEIEEIT
jgi:hypothetical protein